jgi:hypothetical protein
VHHALHLPESINPNQDINEHRLWKITPAFDNCQVHCSCHGFNEHLLLAKSPALFHLHPQVSLLELRRGNGTAWRGIQRPEMNAELTAFAK